MAKPNTYTQCELRHGTTIKVCWIPSAFARISEPVRLKGVVGEWVVEKTFGTLPADQIEGQSHNAGDIWEATSGSTPRGNK